MLSFFFKYWRGISLAALLNVNHIWSGVKWLLDWASRLDLVASHINEFEKLRGVAGLFTDPPPWAVFPSVLIGALAILWDIRRHREGYRPRTLKARMTIPIIGMVLCGAGFLGFASWQIKNAFATSGAPEPPQTTELYKRAKDDFRHSGGIATADEKISYAAENIAAEVDVNVWIRSDLISMGKYLVFYIPRTIDMQRTANPQFPTVRLTFETIKRLAGRFQEIMKNADARGSAGLGDVGTDNWRYSTDAIFTGAIYVYYEGNLTEVERVDLRALYHQRGTNLYFRDYRYIRESSMKPGP
jgi:hypothetical protein